MDKILFINFGGLGDEILFLPAIISVRKDFPNAKITLALEPRSKGITALTDVIDNVMFADIKKHRYLALIKLLIKIWRGKYDIVISSGSNKFISLFLFMTFIKKRIGYNTGKLSKLLLTDAVELNKNQYAAKMYHDLVRSITSYNTEIPQINVDRKTVKENTILIHPGVSLLSVSKGMIKTVPAKTWANVINLLYRAGKKVILAGGPDDYEVIKVIQDSVPGENFENYFGKTKSLKELAELISGAEKFICSDSAPMHIAAALETKTYAIFGSTDDKKLIPDNGKVIPIKAKGCSCLLRPCLWEKRQTTCSSLECLNISAEEIADCVLNN